MSAFNPGYYPQGKNWYVRMSHPLDGRMLSQIIQNGEVIASLDRPGTGEEIMTAARQYMSEQENQNENIRSS